MNKKLILQIIVSAALSGVITFLCSTQLFINSANVLNDALYQRPTIPRDEIVLIGIDDYAIDEFGPWPWTRDVMASALEYLNSDPEMAPAVIGVDAVFAGYSEYPDADDYFVDVASVNDNIVMATMAMFENELVVNNDNTFYMDDYSITSYDEPFPELLDVTSQAHVNAMLDFDGILRHAIWQIELPDGRIIPSFHQAIYNSYMEYIGDDDIVVPPTDARHRWYVPLSSDPFAMNDGFSVADLVYGELDPALFADKIVLIGPYSAGLQDSYPTAIDHSTAMYGVEYQANTIAALLNKDMKTEILLQPQLILLFVVTFIALMWFPNRKMLHSTIAFVVLTGGYVLFCSVAWNMGYVFNVAYIPLAITFCFILSVSANYVESAFQRHKITNTFRRYVAPEIVTELLKGDPEALELGGKLTDIAVLFVDIRGFTTLSEELDPPTVVEIVNSYLTLTSKCIFDNNGTLDKYVGDCTMAFWGAPIPQDDCIYKAVKAACDMVEGATALGLELEQKYGKTVNFGIGVNFGSAVVGNIGSTSRMDYTAIGDTVNTAARLESNAPAGQIYVSRVIADALNGRVEFTSLGNSIKLKGKSENFEILKVEKIIDK